jgi:hypothetical protein
MSESKPPHTEYNPNYIYLAAFVPIAWMLISHASDTNAFSEPSTYAGILAGLAVVGTAGLLGRRKRG